MYEPRQYDSPPVYTPPYNTTSHSFYTPRNVHSSRSHYIPYSYNAPPESYYMEEKPQHFYRWFSPPGFVKTFQGATVIMCFLIFACVASTLVWDMHGVGYGGGYGAGAGGGGVGGTGSGYYGGSYGYASSYMTPYSAKSAMISMAAINFLVSLGFLVGSFSRSHVMRGRTFYLTMFICDIILAVLQGIIDIIFVIGVNPMSQSSQSMLYNPMLMMCQNIQGSPSLSGSVGTGFPGGMYNQYLQHYCYMDPEEAVALVLGLMVVFALSLAAYYAYKTRSKIWRHGKANIFWDQPLGRPSEGHDVQDWVNHVGDGRSAQQVPTVVSERAAPDLRAENSVVSYGNGTVSVYSEGTYNGNTFSANNTNGRGPEPLYQNTRVTVCSSSSSEEADSIKKPPQHAERERRRDRELSPPAQVVESQYETGYTTGGDTGNELDRDQRDYLHRLYPEITSDQQRHRYKREFDSDLARYKSLCAEMDDISDQMHKLNRELDTLEEGSMKYQGVADEYNRLKELKRMPDYQSKKKESKQLRHKLFHIKRLVKNYDRGLC
ncbi:occludin-like [Diretmus argenteus]